MATEKVTVEIIPCFTLFGTRKKYKLPDMSYAQWLILENNYPKYYFYLFDPIYDSFRDELNAQRSLNDFLETQFKKHKKPFTTIANVIGFCNYSKANFELFELEKFPLELLT